MESTNKEASYMLQIFHTLLDIFYCSYLFIFPKKYDIYFAGFILLITLQWCCSRNECMLSYYEKKWLDPDYRFASRPKYLPHYKTFHNTITITIVHAFILINLLTIIYRAKTVLVKGMAFTALALAYICSYII
jgi:hypothetical protein